MYIKTKIFLLICIGYSTLNFALALPIMGSQVAGQISAYSDAGARIIPLPKGGWKVVFSSQSTKFSLPDGYGKSPQAGTANKIDTAYLIQSDSSFSPFILGVQYNTNNTYPKYQDVLCKSSAAYYADSYDSAMWSQRCLEVGYTTNSLIFDGWPDSKSARSALVKEGARIPQGYIEMNYVQYNGKGDWLQIRLLVNPEDYGLRGGDASQWDKDMISNNPKNKQFMDEYVSFAKAYAESLAVSFKGQFSAFNADFSPSASYIGGAATNAQSGIRNAPSNNSSITSKEEDVCKDIGFKPKTEPFANCVLQLLQKKNK